MYSGPSAHPSELSEPWSPARSLDLPLVHKRASAAPLYVLRKRGFNQDFLTRTVRDGSGIEEEAKPGAVAAAAAGIPPEMVAGVDGQGRKEGRRGKDKTID